MSYSDIKKIYLEIINNAGQNFGIESNFYNCSYDSINNCHLIVNNYTKCFNFERIRDFLLPTNKPHACDSLFFSDALETLLFIEFKNRPYDSEYESIPDLVAEQASDSLHVHNIACGGQVDPNSASLDFLAIISSEKNAEITTQRVAQLMLEISGQVDNGDNANLLNKQLEDLINNLFLTKYPGVSLQFRFVGVYTDQSFNTIISRYINN